MSRVMEVLSGPARLVYQSMGLALVQIWANRTRSILTTIGIIIGVASVTSVIAALSGLKAKVLADFETFGTRTIWVWPDRPKIGPMRNASWQVIRFRPETFDDMLDYCRSVDCFTRSCSVSATVRFADRKVEGVRVNGVESAWHKIMNKQVVMGREFSVIDQQQGRNICIIPPDLRDQLRLDKDCVGQSIVANGTTYRIVGVIEKRDSGMFDGGGNQKSYEILVPFNTIYRNNRTWMSIMAASKKTESAEEAKAEIAFFLRKVRHIAPGEPDTFGIETIESHINTFQNISKMITLVAGSVVSISLLVGGIGIMNIMLVSVSERTREIGLRKAVGARRSAILMQFLVESVVLSLLGGIFGILLGQLFTISIARAVSLLDKMYIPIWAIMVSFGFSAAVGVFFGMFPAIKAANLDPIEALRHE